ncbi:MAG TPA: prepilin-type N-terminal cleavage/methylation domain-containing protein [Candidatus Angelobacter sp.]|nr:prepilin-type N-terminal cleavage/methylation domain-containing protein [Candidatus Angelobacter sp.]
MTPTGKFDTRKENGFSLIELLIVVAIILIIAAIAIPSLLKSRVVANDAAAAATVRSISTAEASYALSFPSTGYAGLAELGPNGNTCPTSVPTPTSACLLDNFLGCTSSWCVKDAFWYTVTLTTGDYTISAVPIGGQGDKVFCSTGDAVIHTQTPPTITALAGTAPGSGLDHDTCNGLPSQ